MGRVLTVTGRLAETPYRIRKIERNVYSHLHRHDRKPADLMKVLEPFVDPGNNIAVTD